LDQQGYKVWSACLTENGKTELARLCTKGNCTPFLCDITNPEQVQRAVEFVSSSTTSLYALVNNAGISEGNLMDWTSMSMYRRVMEVNFFAHVQMTKSFLSLLLANPHRDSRVVNVTSMAGRIAAGGMSAYASSKFALEGFSDSLRREMFPFGLKVSIIEPAFMATPIVSGVSAGIAALWDKKENGVDVISAESKARWGEEYFQHRVKGYKGIKNAESPTLAVDVMLDAINSQSPYLRYYPGKAANIFRWVSCFPGEVADFIIRRQLGNDKVQPAALKKKEI
jgi:NAD(P)-dependent dehydrogenase (short-subunit alcohol dehydrogenase family)